MDDQPRPAMPRKYRKSPNKRKKIIDLKPEPEPQPQTQKGYAYHIAIITHTLLAEMLDPDFPFELRKKRSRSECLCFFLLFAMQFKQ